MLIPAEVFSGDIMLAALSPKGRLHVLVGDFTGHGLAAALGAMPVAETFRATVALDLAAEAMLEMLNQKVADALPRGHFLAASLISIDRDLSRMVAANCGMPDLLLCGPHGVRERIASASFALGIVEDASFADAVRTVAIARGERLIMATDGITEAVNADGAAFGEARLEAVLAQEDEGGAGAPALATAALHQFRGQTPLADDVSIVEIRFNEALFGAAPAADPLAPETASPPRS
jgi:serine phosphatase RsbU (regulator of sigma subunit)